MSKKEKIEAATPEAESMNVAVRSNPADNVQVPPREPVEVDLGNGMTRVDF